MKQFRFTEILSGFNDEQEAKETIIPSAQLLSHRKSGLSSPSIQQVNNRMECRGWWTLFHYAQLAEETIVATKDPIDGIYQNSADYQLKLYQFFCSLEQSAAKNDYLKRSKSEILITSKTISTAIAAFRAAVTLVNAMQKTSGCTSDEILSLMIERHIKNLAYASETEREYRAYSWHCQNRYSDHWKRYRRHISVVKFALRF